MGASALSTAKKGARPGGHAAFRAGLLAIALAFVSACGTCRSKGAAEPALDTLASTPAPPKLPDAKLDPKRPPRALFWATPEFSSVRLSPAGTDLAFIALANDVPQLWVKSMRGADDVGEATVVTGPSARAFDGATEAAVLSFVWAYDGRHILFVRDPGPAAPHVFSVDVASGETRDLTPYGAARGTLVRLSPLVPKEAVFAINDRDPKVADLYRIDVGTGARTLLHRNTEAFTEFVLDARFKLRFGRRERDDGGAEIDRSAEKGTFVPVIGFSTADASVLQLHGTDATGNFLYLADARERALSGAYLYDVKTRKRKLLAEDAKADVDTAMVNPRTGKVEAVSFVLGRRRWVPVDKDVAKDFAALRAQLRGDFVIRSRTDDDARWLVEETLDASPDRWFVYERRSKKASLVLSSNRKLETVALARSYPKTFKAKDGLELHAYLTLPREADTLGDGRAGTAVPLVVVPVDTPLGRHTWGYKAREQWLATRGYAVLSVNTRGASGFGKANLLAGRAAMDAMSDNLVDAAEWAFREGISLAGRVALLGTAFGGARALSAVARAPASFACAVALHAPADLASFFSSPLAVGVDVEAPSVFHNPKSLGALVGANVDTEAGANLLRAASPFAVRASITRPVFLANGASDSRSDGAQLEKFAEALHAANVPLAFLKLRDATTVFARDEDRLATAAVAEAFLADCVGGTYAPYGKDFRWANFDVVYGASLVPGLSEALDRKGY